MPNYRDLLNRTKARIREISTEEAEAAREADRAVVLDVREPEEYEQGAIPGSVHIARGQLESQVEGRLLDKDAPVLIVCAGGHRSAFAAETLGELGYTDVVSVVGGFNRWKDEGRDWRVPSVLSPEQRNRYQRHLLLPEVGVEGQQKLLGARVLLLGAGGLGSPAALYLAAAGVGTLGIIDMDVVDESNLQRQIIHRDQGIGMPKVHSAAEAMRALNPFVEVRPYQRRLTEADAAALMAEYDLVIDGTDNFDTRYLVNRVAVELGKPLLAGAITQWEGQVSLYHPAAGAPCYQCVFPQRPAPGMVPTCAEAGVAAPLPGVIGSILAMEAVKHLTGAGQTLAGRLMIHDALYAETRVIALRPRPECPVCGVTHG